MLYRRCDRAKNGRMAELGSNRIRAGWIDRVAIGLSGLCLIHCVATVLLLSLVASIGGLLVNPLIHEIGLMLAIVLGLFAFASGYREHGRMLPVLIGGAGLCAMAYALTLRHGMPGEVVFTVAGVLLVATAHHLNRRASVPLSV